MALCGGDTADHAVGNSGDGLTSVVEHKVAEIGKII